MLRWLVEGNADAARKGDGERAGAMYTLCNAVSMSSSSGSSTGGTDGEDFDSRSFR